MKSNPYDSEGLLIDDPLFLFYMHGPDQNSRDITVYQENIPRESLHIRFHFLQMPLNEENDL